MLSILYAIPSSWTMYTVTILHAKYLSLIQSLIVQLLLLFKCKNIHITFNNIDLLIAFKRKNNSIAYTRANSSDFSILKMFFFFIRIYEALHRLQAHLHTNLNTTSRRIFLRFIIEFRYRCVIQLVAEKPRPIKRNQLILLWHEFHFLVAFSLKSNKNPTEKKSSIDAVIEIHPLAQCQYENVETSPMEQFMEV